MLDFKLEIWGIHGISSNGVAQLIQVMDDLAVEWSGHGVLVLVFPGGCGEFAVKCLVNAWGFAQIFSSGWVVGG